MGKCGIWHGINYMEKGVNTLLLSDGIEVKVERYLFC